MCIHLINQGSLFVVESFVEYFQASWQGLGTSQVIFLLVEAVGMPTLSYFLGLNNFDISWIFLYKMRFIQIIMKVLQVVRVPAMGDLLAVYLSFKSQVNLIQTVEPTLQWCFCWWHWFTDVYLMGTVMLIFGMGLYELFVSTLEVAGEAGEACEVQGPACGSNLFGLFRLTVSLF